MSHAAAVPRAWSWGMVIASTLYLVPEAIFNTQLVNVAGQGIFSEHQLRDVELFGRAVSGIGVSLLVCDALGGRFVRGLYSALALIVCISALVWPTVFFGQKVLVDELIIDPSSSEQRQHAVTSSVIRGALSENAIRIEGVDYDPDRKLNPQELTFMALFGGMVFADKTLAQTIDAKKTDVVREMVQQRTYADFEQYWQDYARMYEEMKASYESYAEGSRRYNRALNSIPERQVEYWDTVQTEVKDGWDEYQSALKAHRARAHTKAERHADALYDDLDDISNCESKRCVNRELKGYQNTLADLGFSEFPIKHWYKVRDVSTTENVASSLLAGALTGGATLLMQGVDAATGGDGGFKDKEYSYTNETAHYGRKIMALDQYKDQFEERTGYPRGIENHWSFRRHPVTVENVKQKLAQKGLNLPPSWHINDRETFNGAVEDKVRERATEKWRAELSQEGLDIPPNLTWEKFQRQEAIQDRIAERMGEYYVKPTYAHWNRKTFKERVIDPQVEKEVEQIVERMEAVEGSFADGKPNETIGKQMMRAVIVPPISMGLSLLLVVMTLVKLPKKYFLLVAGDKFPLDGMSSRNKMILKGGFNAVIFAVIFAVPLFLWSSDYTEPGSTVHYFLDKTEEHGSPAARYSLNWILHAQPVMHPMGQSFNEHTGFYEMFSQNNDALEVMDRKVLGGEGHGS